MDIWDWLSGILQYLKPWQKGCSKMLLLCGLDNSSKTSLLQMLRDDLDPLSHFIMKEEFNIGGYAYTLRVDALYI